MLDLSELRKKLNHHIDLDVLKGIAYNKKSDTFFITGKNWDKIFEIKSKCNQLSFMIRLSPV